MSEKPGRALTEMEWRVGRAIYEATARGRRWEDVGEAGRLACLQCAHAAIAAMREPTVAMYEASRFPNAGCIGDQWRAMIDAALGEGR